MLQSMGSQRVGHNLVKEQQQQQSLCIAGPKCIKVNGLSNTKRPTIPPDSFSLTLCEPPAKRINQGSGGGVKSLLI